MANGLPRAVGVAAARDVDGLIEATGTIAGASRTGGAGGAVAAKKRVPCSLLPSPGASRTASTQNPAQARKTYPAAATHTGPPQRHKLLD